MSTLRRAVGGPATRNLLAPLRDTQIILSKPALPAEILALILDFLAVSDLLRWARVSKRMREMVYDDTRWVRRLSLMGCWNEAAARARVEAERQKTTTIALRKSSVASTGAAYPSTVAAYPSTVLPDSPRKANRHHGNGGSVDADDGFDLTALSPTRSNFSSTVAPAVSNEAALGVLDQARSIRGSARREYGRVHAVLGPFYKDAARSKEPSHARVFRVYRNPDQQARMLAQLVRFARADLAQGWGAREERVLATVEAFEGAVAQEFEQGLEAGDVEGKMKKYAHVLVTLNGGQRAIDDFIAENALLRDGGAQFGDPMDCVGPAGADAVYLDELHAFFHDLSAASNAQIDIIDRAFPPHVSVALPLVRRIATDLVRPYLDRLFGYLGEKSTESYLRAVSAAYDQCLQFKGSLQSPRNPTDNLGQTLDEMVTDMFSPHVDRYLKEELAFFRRRSDTEVTGWERQLSQQHSSIESLYMANVNRQADKRDFLASFKKVVMAPASFAFGNKTGTGGPALFNGDHLKPPSRSASRGSRRSGSPAPTRSATETSSGASSPGTELPQTELAAKAAIMKSRLEGIRTLFSLEVALNLVHMAKGSIERTAVFARANAKFAREARTQCEGIFVLLLQTLGNRHVRAGFDQAVQHLARYNPRAVDQRDDSPTVAPLVVFLELVNVGDMIQQMLEVFYEQELVATKLTDRHDFLGATGKEKKRFEQMLDERVAAGLNKGIEVLMAEVEYICGTTQNVEDFNPGTTGIAIGRIVDVRPTNTAVWVVEVVNAHTKMLAGCTDKNMLEVFNQEVGLRLFATLCKHLKRQRISVAGSTRLIGDINHYFGFVQTFQNKGLLQYFRALRELSQIYLIEPTEAKELAAVIADTDRFSGIFRPEEVLEFAQRRADWYTVKPKVEKAMYGMDCAVM